VIADAETKHELEELIVDGSGLYIVGNYLGGIIANSLTNVGDLDDLFNLPPGYTLVAYDLAGEELDKDAIIGTGTKLVLYNNGDEIDEITVVIQGDVTGNGLVTVRDAQLVLHHITAVREGIVDEQLDGPFLQAANFTPLPGIGLGDVQGLLELITSLRG
jgi:hypothetical protein